MKSTLIKAARAAGKVILENYENIGKIKFKNPRSIVTKVDILSEKRILETIKKKFSDHNFITEESGTIGNGSEYTWIIDPIDGTTNFVSKIDHFAVSIALAKNNEIIMGIVYKPCTNDMYFAEKGKGSFLNNKKLKVSTKNRLKDCLLGFSLPSQVDIARNTLSILSKNYGNFRALRNFGSAALNLCYLAEGKFDLFFALQFNLWDVAAGELIIEEAGGKITNLNDKKWSINDKNIVVSNSILHEKFVKLLK